MIAHYFLWLMIPIGTLITVSFFFLAQQFRRRGNIPTAAGLYLAASFTITGTLSLLWRLL